MKTDKDKQKHGSLVLAVGVKKKKINKKSQRRKQKNIILLGEVIQGFDGDMQQGYELQDQVIDPGHYSLKSHSELLKMLLFLICTEHF